MDQQVARLPQMARAPTRASGATPTEDLHKLILAEQAWIDGVQAINAEMLAFWQSRLKASLAAGGQLLACSSADGALDIQFDYAKAALQAYLDQSARITGLLMRALGAGLLAAPDAAALAPTRALAA